MQQVIAISKAPETDAAEQANALLMQSGVEASSENADFLSFILANELYGVDIKDVEEIRVWEQATPIPRSPDYVLGVINLRGMIVPVVDLRKRFLVGVCDYLPTTVVIVLRTSLDESERLMGIVVDAVSDVVCQGDRELNGPVGESLVTPYLQGLLNVGDQVMSLLNTEALLDIDRILRGH